MSGRWLKICRLLSGYNSGDVDVSNEGGKQSLALAIQAHIYRRAKRQTDNWRDQGNHAEDSEDAHALAVTTRIVLAAMGAERQEPEQAQYRQTHQRRSETIQLASSSTSLRPTMLTTSNNRSGLVNGAFAMGPHCATPHPIMGDPERDCLDVTSQRGKSSACRAERSTQSQIEPAGRSRRERQTCPVRV